MIVAYAQARGRQGLEAAVDGLAVEDVSPEFIEFRERGRAVAGSKHVYVGNIEVRYSRGLTRLVFDDTALNQDGSPITVVIDVNAAQNDFDETVSTAAKTVSAIHRSADKESLRAAIKIAIEIHKSYLMRRRIVIAGCIVVIAGIVITAAALIINTLPKQ